MKVNYYKVLYVENNQKKTGKIKEKTMNERQLNELEKKIKSGSFDGQIMHKEKLT